MTINKERQDSEGNLETGAWAMTSRWSLFGDYDISAKHTVTTLMNWDVIPERAIKQGLPLLYQKRGQAPFFINQEE